MAAYKKVYEIVIEKIEDILIEYSDGLNYSDLTSKIFVLLPEIPKNSVHGTFHTYRENFPKNIIKPRRGFYKWVDDLKEISENSELEFKNDLSVINGKLLNIKLKNFRQFKDVEFDFTYPIGHEREGEPLDKICFLGQSGTGKTTLINLIRHFSFSEFSKSAYKIFELDETNEIEISYRIPNFVDVTIYLEQGKTKFKVIKEFKKQKDKDFNYELYKHLNGVINKLIYFPTDAIKKLDEIDSPSNKFSQENILEDKILDFGILDFSNIWVNVTGNIKEYNKAFAEKSLEFTKKIIDSQNIIEITTKATDELNIWLKDNKNPLKKLADECLDKILNKFGVRVKTEIANIETINFISLETNETEISERKGLNIKDWSTGTKQIVIRAMTLYELKPKNAIIIFDEPENSLFPDVQNEIVDFYTGILKENSSQFIFASHSPIVASAFEPFEIIELKFDDTNTFVEQELYYNGERKLENYFINPQYLKWGDVLKYIFDVKEESNEKRNKLMLDLAILDTEIDHLVSEGKKDLAKQKQVEYEKLADLIKWNFEK